MRYLLALMIFSCESVNVSECYRLQIGAAWCDGNFEIVNGAVRFRDWNMMVTERQDGTMIYSRDTIIDGEYIGSRFEMKGLDGILITDKSGCKADTQIVKITKCNDKTFRR